MLERFLFPSSPSPPHLPISIHLPREVEAADIGAGSISYVNACVSKSRPLTPGAVPASIAVSPAGSGQRPWRASRSPGLGWGREVWPDPPPSALGMKDAAPGGTLPQQPLTGGFGVTRSFRTVSVSGFPGQRLSRPRGDESLGLGSGNPFDYKFIAGLILLVARGWLVSLSEKFVVYLAAG